MARHLQLTDLHLHAGELLATEGFAAEPRRHLVDHAPVSLMVGGPALLFVAAGVDAGVILEAQLAIATITAQAEAA